MALAIQPCAIRASLLFCLSSAGVLRRNSDRIGGFEKGEFELNSARKVVAAQICVRRADTVQWTIKVKHERTADCLVAGFRWHKKGAGTTIGSLLLGLYTTITRSTRRGVHGHGAQAARRRADAAARRRARRPSVAGLGRGTGGSQREETAAARRDQ
jgi:hypothetical protein